MARRSGVLVIAFAAAIVGVAAAAVVLRSDLRCAGFAGPGVTAAELPPARPPGRLRLATWTLRSFPLDEGPQGSGVGHVGQTNICDLERAVAGLDADVIGFAEILDARRFPPILRRSAGVRRYQLVQSRGGGGRGEHLAIAWDDRLLEATGEPVELREAALDRNSRPALALRLRSRDDPRLEITVVQVHLEPGPEGAGVRAEQHHALAGWLDGELAAGRSDRLLVMGNFNASGGPDGSADSELEWVDRLYAGIGVARVASSNRCSAYWEGDGEPDGVQLPALLDHIFVRGLGPAVGEARSWLHCARRACEPFESREGHEDGTFWDVSDHCPVTVDLPWPPSED